MLTDCDVQAFLLRGFHPLQSSLPALFHAQICTDTHALLSSHGNPGNNILPAVPALQSVLLDPVVTGALTSLLGTRYQLQAHRHCHVPGGKDQPWHKDSLATFRRPIRDPAPRMVMLMYYPQIVDADMGPTAIKPGTQYNTLNPCESSHCALLLPHHALSSISCPFFDSLLPSCFPYNLVLVCVILTRIPI